MNHDTLAATPLFSSLCRNLESNVMGMALISHRRKFVLAFCLLLAAGAAATWYFLPVMNFGGRYRVEGGSEIFEFQDGRFYHNGLDYGSYTIWGRKVNVFYDYANESVSGTIGWSNISMPIPLHGQAVLVKEQPAAKKTS